MVTLRAEVNGTSAGLLVHAAGAVTSTAIVYVNVSHVKRLEYPEKRKINVTNYYY